MKRALFILLFVFVWCIGICADRYWVGGTGDWDAATTTHWSSSSGGAGGSSVPTASDNVFFDGNSGGGTVTIPTAVNASCAAFNGTGYTGTITRAGTGNLTVGGSLTLGSGMTWTMPLVLGFSGNATITSNGATLGGSVIIAMTNTTDVVDFADDFITSSTFDFRRGVMNLNGNDLTCTSFAPLGTLGKTLNLGAGTIFLTGTGNVWNPNYTNTTVNASTSTIKITGTTNDAVTFAGGGRTFNNLWFDRGASTGGITITGANTFNDFTDDGTAAHTITFPNSTTTITSWDVEGSSGNVITLQRTGGSGTWTLSAASGNICSDWISISNSTATGGADFYAGANSTDGTGNTDWSFTACPAGGTSNMFLIFGKP